MRRRIDCCCVVAPVGRKERVGLDVRLAPKAVHERGQLCIAAAALMTVSQVFGGRWIERFSGPLRHVAVEQAIFGKMMCTSDHGFPPSRPRSFRAARNRWTRTVDSFKPVMALTSRGVQSP